MSRVIIRMCMYGYSIDVIVHTCICTDAGREGGLACSLRDVPEVHTHYSVMQQAAGVCVCVCVCACVRACV